MRYGLLISLVAALVLPLTAQPLRDINYNYMYDPTADLRVHMQAARTPSGWEVAYHVEFRDSTVKLQEYILQCELRKDLAEKIGETVNIAPEADISNHRLTGKVLLPIAASGSILTFKLVRPSSNHAWIYYQYLEPKYPPTVVVTSSGAPYLKKYQDVGKSISLTDSTSWIVSYYNDDFPAAAPAFSEAQGRVTPRLRVDSLMTYTATNEFQFFAKGLYLFQKDTLSEEGVALRAQLDYPRFTLVQNLPGPFIYICTKQEYDRLEASNGDKKTFDRTVLTITGDADRARKLIRNYFRRVELANTYFTSYKEGWKTDRGMIYIIFGTPDEVFKLGDREVWKYDNEIFKVTLNFTKSATLFDPDNYVLIRDSKYKEQWYEAVDLWRNARLRLRSQF